MDMSLLSDAMLDNGPGELPKEKPKPVVDNTTRRDWNDYTSWLDKKGLKGNPVLDRGDKSLQVLDQYIKENPSTSLTREHITPIQEDFSKYRSFIMNKIEKSGAGYAAGANKENFMRGLSQVDGIPGSKTSSFSFPSAYLDTFDNGKKVSTENKGFSTTGTDVYKK